MKKSIIVLVLGVLGLLALIAVIMNFSYKNSEIRLREQITSKIEVNKSSYTKMWEIITTQANVADKYSEDFKEIYPQLISGRYSNGGGQLMQWIQEHNPNFDTSLYKKLMRSVEAQRESFHTNQVQLQDLSREHNTLLKVFPSSLFLSDIKPIDVPNVINVETQKAFETGIEQKMELFK